MSARCAPIDAADVLMQLRELFRVSQQHFQRIEARCGLSGAQVWALAELDERPGLTVSELAARLAIRLSTASNVLRKLDERGLIRRERGRADHRVVTIVLTPGGQRLLRKAPRPVQGVLQEALGRMPAEAIGRLHRDLALLLAGATVRDRRGALRPLSVR
jgi:DNA-binding MarR family transcriptional regulator